MQGFIALTKIERAEKKDALKSRIINSLIILELVVLFLIAVYLINTPWNQDSSTSSSSINKWNKKIFTVFQILIITPFIFISYKEILDFAKIKNSTWKSWLFLVLTIIPIMFLLINIPFKNGKLDKNIISKYFAIFISIFILLALFSWSLYKKVFVFNYQILPKKFSFFRLCLSSYIFWNSAIFISLVNGFGMISLLLLGVSLMDIFSFAFGSKYGVRKISKLSPKKTLEGLIIGMVLSFLAIYLTVLIFNIQPRIYDTAVPMLTLIFTTPIILLIGAMGDLFFSKQKRIFGEKDFSQLLGAHGGFWDRFDSHTFSLGTIFLVNFLFNLIK